MKLPSEACIRRWALANPQLFTAPSAQPTPLLELGAGVGLLGISLAVGLGVDVLLSDFDGHHVGTLVEPEDSVLALLEHNARANAELAAAQSLQSTLADSLQGAGCELCIFGKVDVGAGIQ